MTVKKPSRYGEYGSFEHLFFLLVVFFFVFVSSSEDDFDFVMNVQLNYQPIASVCGD